MAISRHIVVISLTSFTKKAPAHRGFLGSGIVPTGELEGREDRDGLGVRASCIVPTGELEGREDLVLEAADLGDIVPTGELGDPADSRRSHALLELTPRNAQHSKLELRYSHQ